MGCRKLGVLVWASSTMFQPPAPRVTTEAGKIPSSSRWTWTSRSSSSRVTLAAKSGEPMSSSAIVASRSRCSSSSASTSSTILSGAPQCREDAVLLTSYVAGQPGHELGQPGHRGREVPRPQGLSEVARLVDEGGVLSHQVGDRRHASAPAVVTHVTHSTAARRTASGPKVTGGSAQSPRSPRVVMPAHHIAAYLRVPRHSSIFRKARSWTGSPAASPGRARHPWRTIATWVLVLGAVFSLAGSGGGTFIDAFSAKGSQSERALRAARGELPRGGPGHGPGRLRGRRRRDAAGASSRPSTPS